MNVHEHDWTRRPTRVAMVALVATLLVGVVGSDLAGTASARRGSHAQAELVQKFFGQGLDITDNKTTGPSSMAVSGFETPIADVDVTLFDLRHSQMSDVDILLVGPGGQTALIVSNVGFQVQNSVVLDLDDQATDQLPLADPLTTGRFQPTNYDFGTGPDIFTSPPAPVANPKSGSALSVFNGTNPNGTWSLFIDDEDADAAPSSGRLDGGWTITITTANGVPKAAPDRFQAQAGTPLTVPADGVLGNDRDPDGEVLTAVLAGQPRQGTLSLQSDGGFTYTANRKAKSSDSFTYLAQDETGLRALATVDLQITKAKKHKKGRGKGKN
jgi:subtilisin-like proprotein convertase family protein